MPIHALLVRCERGTDSDVIYVPCLEIENDFKIKIQEYVSKFDSEKAVLLAQLEKELNVRQELILESARKRIDDLNEEANRLKMVVFDVCSLPFHTPVIGSFRVSSEKLKLKAMPKSVGRTHASFHRLIVVSSRSNH